MLYQPAVAAENASVPVVLLSMGNVTQGKRPSGRPDPQFADLMDAVARSQDRDAFSRLFAHFGPRVRAYLIRAGAPVQTAEELMQEVMLTVWRRAALFDRRKAAVSTWIFTIARNKRVDSIRRESRAELDPNDPALVPPADETADTLVERAQATKRLNAAVKDLPEEQLEVLRRSYFDEESHSTIAADLGLPLGTVKSRLRLALNRLRAAMEEKA